MRPVVVAIDGPSGAGKSTVARELARALGFQHLDTGAMFRAVTWALLDCGAIEGSQVRLDEADRPRALAALELDLDAEGRVTVAGRAPGDELRSARVEAAVSAVAALPEVRAVLRGLQREFAARGPLVCEGRDMGTVVFPDAPFKFYLEASVAERARRRLADFRGRGRAATLAQVTAEIDARDALDAARAHAPLRAAADAVRIDTTGIGVAEVVERLAAIVRAAIAAEAAAGGPA